MFSGHPAGMYEVCEINKGATRPLTASQNHDDSVFLSFIPPPDL